MLTSGIIFAIRGGNVNINIKEKFSWVNKNAVPIKFECLSFDRFSSHKNFTINKSDPAANFYQNDVSNAEAN